MCPGFTDDTPGTEFSGADACELMDQLQSPSGLPDGILPGGRPAPGTNVDGVPQPWTSMIVKFDPVSGEWRDPLGRNFSNALRFNLPDLDLFTIDATSLETQGQ